MPHDQKPALSRYWLLKERTYKGRNALDQSDDARKFPEKWDRVGEPFYNQPEARAALLLATLQHVKSGDFTGTYAIVREEVFMSDWCQMNHNQAVTNSYNVKGTSS